MGNDLGPSSSPLVWVDCEMTGLSLQTDTIIEVCCYITSPTLSLLTPTPYHVIINKPLEVMSRMDDWCTRTHSSSGLTAAVLSSTVTLEQAQAGLLAFIKQHVPYPKYGLLAGNSVHADRMFLDKEFKEVVEYLHHRIVDVSSFKECVRMWCGKEVIRGVPRKKGVHRAQEDILESIEELRYYKRVFFDGK
ncbi:ribonuclease H-like protein [Ascobolus immersus RN42]|uniref:Ribonuclease H-like protein n=1 Tax=Ascobolus immersus RN42 TaxID=1160509 RepID=A0A3N4HX83_ASCIM|nr:ribonuclease H-like protein [Ascobolus immersus RN42]